MQGGIVEEQGMILVRREGWPSEEPGIGPSALLTGELSVGEGGCLRVEGRPAGHHIPIWPPGYSLDIERGNIRVLDYRGSVVASVGDRVSFGGGETRRGEAGIGY